MFKFAFLGKSPTNIFSLCLPQFKHENCTHLNQIKGNDHEIDSNQIQKKIHLDTLLSSTHTHFPNSFQFVSIRYQQKNGLHGKKCVSEQKKMRKL